MEVEEKTHPGKGSPDVAPGAGVCDFLRKFTPPYRQKRAVERGTRRERWEARWFPHYRQKRAVERGTRRWDATWFPPYRQKKAVERGTQQWIVVSG